MTQSGKSILAADLFCGAGGTSSGLLAPHELAAAQGLAGYKFTGKKTEIVKQIGNAVPKGTATALCRELLV